LGKPAATRKQATQSAVRRIAALYQYLSCHPLDATCSLD
jgi:hypothetical protein